MVKDKAGKIFDDRRKEDKKVKADRRKKENLSKIKIKDS